MNKTHLATQSFIDKMGKAWKKFSSAVAGLTWSDFLEFVKEFPGDISHLEDFNKWISDWADRIENATKTRKESRAAKAKVAKETFLLLRPVFYWVALIIGLVMIIVGSMVEKTTLPDHIINQDNKRYSHNTSQYAPRSTTATVVKSEVEDDNLGKKSQNIGLIITGAALIMMIIIYLVRRYKNGNGYEIKTRQLDTTKVVENWLDNTNKNESEVHHG
jgi:hypothetical protein